MEILNKKSKAQNGITLIALVITIIVLLILAGVAINMAIDSDGLFGKANEAAEKWNTSVGEEEETIEGLYGKLEEMTKDPMELEDDDLNPALKTMILTVSGTSDFVLPIVKEDCSYNFTVDWGDGSEAETYSSNSQVAKVSYLSNNRNYTVKPLIAVDTIEYVATHSYAMEAEYQIKIEGEFDAFNTNQAGEILEINQWGVTNTSEYHVQVTNKIASPSKNTFKEAIVGISSDNITQIPQNTFVGAKEIYFSFLDLQEITIPNTATITSGSRNGVHSIQVQNGHPLYSSIDGVLFSKDGKTLILFPDEREGTYEIPNGVTTVGYRAFETSKLTEIKLPDSLTTIEDYAFSRTDISKIIIPRSVTTIIGQPFSKCYDLETIYCRIESKPDGWESGWTFIGGGVYLEAEWGYTGQ